MDCVTEGARMETRALTLRLPAEQAAQIEAVARADRVSVSEAVRAAIQDRIEARRNDRAFQERIKRMMDEERAVLEQLSK
jgi:Arc/MetJ-type ribon-helix-helix transcriptional regulator